MQAVVLVAEVLHVAVIPLYTMSRRVRWALPSRRFCQAGTLALTIGPLVDLFSFYAVSWPKARQVLLQR